MLYTAEYTPTSRGRQLKLLDAPSLTPAILAVVRCHLVVLAHVYAHVVEVVEAPLLRNPLRGLAVLCNQADRHRQRFVQILSMHRPLKGKLW